jgi:D-alanine--D-alanine ligase
MRRIYKMSKLRVGVLMGGKGLEKEVSLNSGRTICDHLNAARYIIIPLFQKNSQLFLLPWHFLHRGKTTDFEHRLEIEATAISWDQLKQHVDCIYIAQHGRYAEDGTLQGFLEILGVPYVGSKVLASALRMDKIVHKTFLHNAGIAVPRFIVVEAHEIDNYHTYKQAIDKRLLLAQIYDYYVVKPYNEGSSLGISIVDSSNLEAALTKACYIEPGKKKRVLIEERLQGMEFTCIVLIDYKTGNYLPLPPTEIVPEQGTTFFDYEQKYMPGRGIKHTPARCSTETIEAIQKTAIAVMQALDFTTMGRIDGFVTHDNIVVITDPNTLSGMGPSSFIFNQAAEINMSPSDIINHIIETELHQYHMLETIIEQEQKNMQAELTKKIRVAVLFGGASNEKETSLDSGRNVYYKLNRTKYEPIPLFVSDTLELYHLTQSQLVRNSTQEITELLDSSKKIEWNDLPTIADFVFNALHGGMGENGAVQGMLEMLGVPYNGSSVLASALCMNKYKTNQFLAAHGFSTPKNLIISRHPSIRLRRGFDGSKDAEVNLLKDTPFIHQTFFEGKSLIIKPCDDGCSVMVQKASTEEEVIAAIHNVLQYKDAVMIEECIEGMELTVGVIGNDTPRALPPSQAVATSGVLTIEEKFLPGAGENQTPAPLPQEALTFIQRTMEHVYKTIGCKGYVRIDCFYQTAEQSSTQQERVVILEINTLPGLTPATCLFHQAAEVGMRPAEFLDLIIQFGFEEHGSQMPVNKIHSDTNLSVVK